MLSDNQKIQVIHDNRVTRTRWDNLSKEQRKFVLAGLEAGVEEADILGLITKAKSAKKAAIANAAAVSALLFIFTLSFLSLIIFDQHTILVAAATAGRFICQQF
jgi:hypothetical protein